MPFVSQVKRILDNEFVEVNQFNEKCFKLNSTLTSPFSKSHYRTTYITLDGHGNTSQAEYISVYYTSEENSYGAFTNITCFLQYQVKGCENEL